MYYSRVRRRAVASGSKREKGETECVESEREKKKRDWERVSACVVKSVASVVGTIWAPGIDNGSIPSMWLVKAWWERRIQLQVWTESLLLLRSAASILTKKKKKRKEKKKCQLFPHPASYFSWKKRHAANVFFFSFSKAYYLLTISYDTISKLHNLLNIILFSMMIIDVNF